MYIMFTEGNTQYNCVSSLGLWIQCNVSQNSDSFFHGASPHMEIQNAKNSQDFLKIKNAVNCSMN